MAARKEELLPVPYYHVVFTLPEGINRVCLHQPALVYNVLFSSAWSAIQGFAADQKYLGATTGMISILHTWGQTLSLHPHLHCIIPAGGISIANYWKTTRSNGKFLFPVKALSKVFRARFVSALRKALPDESKAFFESLFKTQWVVYAKRPFGGPLQVIEYLGRYTHKIAISNHRFCEMDGDRVVFYYKGYRHGGVKRLMSLEVWEFIRRFALHILPKGFVRIRHYGILSSTRKVVALPTIRKQLQHDQPSAYEKSIVASALITGGRTCPCCRQGLMQHVMDFDFRGPPPLELIRQVVNMELKSGIVEEVV